MPEKARQEKASKGKGDGDAARLHGLGETRVYVLMGGSFSEESRALWMAALLKEQGVKACIRAHKGDGRTVWGVVLGWKKTSEEARQAKQDLLRRVKDILVVPMAAAELEKGLSCR